MPALAARLLLILGLIVWPALGWSQQLTYSVLIDTDQNTTTGCNVGVPSSAPEATIAGIEQRLIATVDQATLQLAATLEECDSNNDMFVNPQGATGAIGLNNGLSAADVIELAVTANLIAPPGSQVGLYFVAEDATEAIDLLPNAISNGFVVADPNFALNIPFPANPASGPPTAIPSITHGGLAILVLLCMGFLYRQLRRREGQHFLGVLLVVLSGVVLAATPDGSIDEWDGIPPLGTAPVAPPLNINIVAVYAAVFNGEMYFRIDVADLEELPSAMDDSYTFLPTADQNVAAPGLFADNGSGADNLGAPTATLISYGGGSLGGAVTDTAAGISAALAGGTLTVNVDGSWSLTGQPFTSGVYTFDYRIENSLGSSDATVTLRIQQPPTAVDDAGYSVVTGSTLMIDAASGVFVDNGAGPDILGDPTATLVNFGGGSLGGAVTDNAAGATVVDSLAGGDLTVNANGSFTLTNPTTAGTFTFLYRLQNAAGFSDATVTLVVTQPPDGFDDTDISVTGLTSTPGSTVFHLAINTASNGVVNAYADNGSGADVLGNPSAPTDAPADVINTVLLADAADAGTGTIGGGAFTVGGTGSIEITAAGAINIAPPTDFVGLIEFDYTLANSVGADATPATVTFAFGERPQCTDDPSYTATGNISINTSNGMSQGVLENDSGDQIRVEVVQGGLNVGRFVPTDQGGSLTVSADGEFTYNPPIGFTGIDTFEYNIANGFGISAPCTVTITVSDLIYFMDSAALAGGNGSLVAPFQSPTEHNGSVPNNAILFIADNGTAYNGVLTLVSGERVIGEGTSGTLFGPGSLTGITLAPLSDAVPSTTGNVADRAQFTSGANGISLNSNNAISGVEVGNTTGTGIVGSSVGNLTISESSIAGTGAGININGGVLAVSLNEVSSNAASINLNNVSGDFDVASGTINSGTNVAVNINGNPVDLGVTLTSVSANGAASSIVLNNTTGSFTVTGDGSTAGSGGTIQNTTGNAVSLTNANNVALNFVNISNSNANGIFGNNVTGFTLNGANVTNNGNEVNEGGLRFAPLDPINNPSSGFNLLGTAVISNSTISGSAEHNIEITNTSSTPLNLSITDSTISTNSSALGADGLLLETRNSAQATVVVTGSTFDDNQSDGIQISAINNSTASLTVNSSTFTSSLDGSSAGSVGARGIVLSAATDADLDFDIGSTTGNTFENFSPNIGEEAINLTVLSTSTSASLLSGRINNNTFTNSGGAIGIDVRGDGALVMEIDNNTANTSRQAIDIITGDAVGDAATSDLTITNNTLTVAGTTANPNNEAIGWLGDRNTTNCLNIRGNDAVASGTRDDILLDDFTSAPGSMVIESGNTDCSGGVCASAEAHLLANNTISDAFAAGIGLVAPGTCTMVP